MTFGGYFLLLCIFAGLYWLGLKVNPPLQEKIISESNNLLSGDEE